MTTTLQPIVSAVMWHAFFSALSNAVQAVVVNYIAGVHVTTCFHQTQCTITCQGCHFNSIWH